MSVGFGFSTGDFIAALELVTAFITALRDSGGSSAEYQALISQMYTLETALLRVKRVKLDDSQHAELVALRQAASQCQRTIDAFWEKIKKYQPSLKDGGSGSRTKDAWRKVKWAICKKDDLVKFKADLIGHTESIKLLLTTIQISASTIQGKSAENNHRSLIGKVQDSYFGCMQRMSVVMERVSTGIQQGKQLLEMTAKVIQTNVEIFKVILEIQAVIAQIPRQVDRQQPVYFVDAVDRHTPFHLEFVTCAESLTAVLRNNFRGIGSGSSKIEKGEFAIQDSVTHKDIDLKLKWETCFFPGQKVDMSMLFVIEKSIANQCPRCSKASSNVEIHGDIQCENCGMIHRSTSIVELVSRNPDEILTQSPKLNEIKKPNGDRRFHNKRKSTFDEEENEIALFKRVRITHTTLMKLPKPNSRPGSPISELNSTNAFGSTDQFLSADNIRDRIENLSTIEYEPHPFVNSQEFTPFTLPPPPEFKPFTLPPPEFTVIANTSVLDEYPNSNTINSNGGYISSREDSMWNSDEENWMRGMEHPDSNVNVQSTSTSRPQQIPKQINAQYYRLSSRELQDLESEAIDDVSMTFSDADFDGFDLVEMRAFNEEEWEKME